MGKFIALAAAVVILVWLIIPKKPNPYPRQTIVIAANPMTVVSWNPADRSLITITLPDAMEADGTHGYGTYSFEAFWRLGEIDKKDGTVLAESMSEALGIPVPWYIGAKSGLVTGSVFTFGNILPFVRGDFRTNIPFSAFLNLVWTLQVVKPDSATVYDFTQSPTMIADDVTIADGSQVLLLDPVNVDARLAHIFEDDQVRTELMTTTVYNTTAMPSLGNRVARLLNNLGVSVVSVGNDTPEVGACTVSGTREALTSKSAQVIESVLGCVSKETRPAVAADLSVRIGAAYAKRFLPN